MSENDASSRPHVVTITLLLVLSSWWGATCWLAHDIHPWAIRLTHFGVSGGLLASYTVGWAVAMVWARSVRRRMIFRALGTSLLLALLVLILEIPALIGVVDYSHLSARLTGEWFGPATSFISDYDLGFRHLPNTKWSGQPRSDMAVTWNLPIRSATTMTFTTDSRGFRNACEMDRADIVLLGDSYIEGAYVSDDETCAIDLERLIGRPVANLAQAGYGTLQELEVLKRFALSMKPRLVAWFFFEGNDLYNDQDFESWLPGRREREAYKTGGWSWSWDDFCDRSFTRTAFRMFRRLLHPLVPNNVATFGDFRDERGVDRRLYFYDYASISFDGYEQALFEKAKNAFRTGRQLCDEHDIRLVLFYVPMKFRVYGDSCTFPPGSPCTDWHPWRLVDHFREFCEQESIRFVDLAEPMREAASLGRVLYSPEDSHWSAQGHAFVAELLRLEWEHLAASAP